MGANSKHYLDVYVWLKTVIYSCNTVSQLMGAKKMIRQYENLYKISYGDHRYNLCEELKHIANNRVDFLLKD